MKLIEIFNNECNYKRVNEINNCKMRNCRDGVKLSDAIYYRFMYAKKDTTKEGIVSHINNRNHTSFSRQSFENKENNIPVETYLNIFRKVCSYYNDTYNNNNNSKLIGIDGTYNNNTNMNEVLNMGFYDITNGIPIDIKSYGCENKNKEILSATNYITSNLEAFRNNIIVADRAYFSYDFMNFLITHNLKFIIRVKGEAVNLGQNVLNPNIKNYNTILNVKNNTRIIKYNSNFQKTVFAGDGKKNSKKHLLEIKNDCVIVTNLLDAQMYTDKTVLELYKSRWDIEVFFKYIKSNYKFQHLKEQSSIQCKKMYICELIITYISKLIEKYYTKIHPIKQSKNGITYKINKSNLINGLFDSILYDIINNSLTCRKLDQFCKAYIKISQNKDNRAFPRTAKTPFTKWYVKGYSNHTKYMSIISAIVDNKVNELNKNLKTLATKIVSIDGVKYG
jgi:hypothetical protein